MDLRTQLIKNDDVSTKMNSSIYQEAQLKVDRSRTNKEIIIGINFWYSRVRSHDTRKKIYDIKYDQFLKRKSRASFIYSKLKLAKGNSLMTASNQNNSCLFLRIQWHMKDLLRSILLLNEYIFEETL